MITRREFVGAFAVGLAGAGSRRARAREETERRVVGARTQQAAERAADRATEVYNVIDLEERGWLVVGEYPAVSASALGTRSDVSYVEPDRRVVALAQNTPWGVNRIDADQVDRRGYTGARAHVAVLDTGIDSDHPDLETNLRKGKAFVEAEGSYPEPWDDDNGHGTHCAGTVAAADNGAGVIGVGAGALLHAAKVLGANGGGYMSDVADGLRWTADQGYDVASMSLGGPNASYLQDACGYAYDRGVLLVAAAGNSGPCTDCVSIPAAYDEVIAVSATGSDDTLADFSSTGPEIELVAPGTAIRSTVPGGYGGRSGTSMACPHVAGAGAHLMALGHPNVVDTTDFADPGGARGRLRDTAEDIGLSANDGGQGLVDVEAALSDAPTPLGEVDTLSFSQPDPNAWREVSLSGDYTEPVVLLGPVSANGGHPVHGRVRNVSSTGFEVQLEEWEYLDGGHTAESMSYLVLETGVYRLADGRRIEAGVRTLDDGGREVSFEGSFPARPVVFSTAQTYNGTQAVVTRQRSVSTTGFYCRLQEEEALGSHATETVGYLVFEQGAKSASGVSFEAGRTPNAVDGSPYAIDFTGTFDRAPAFLAAMQTADGLDTAALRRRALDRSSVEVNVEEERSADGETAHTTEAVGYLAVDGTGPLYGYSNPDAIGETGTLSLDQEGRNDWREVALKRTYTEPVVLASLASRNGDQPVHARVRNVSPRSFEIQLEEWAYTDGSHITETIEYVVAEAGVHELDDGTRVEVGTESVDHRWGDVGFEGRFSNRPAVFSTAQTYNGSHEIITRNREVTTSGFGLRVQEEEGRDGSHTTETVGYLAVTRESGTMNGIEYEAGRTPDAVTGRPYAIDFAREYDRTPVVLCAMQTTDGSDTAALRTVARDATGVEIAIEEETSRDAETAHTTEAVGYLTIGGDWLVGN